jgi:hypothetical protein
VGVTQLPPPAAQRSVSHSAAFISGGAYGLLFLLGFVEGVLGSFHYSRADFGHVPLAAIGFALAMFLTCALGAWAMRGLLGGLLPAIGWFVASFGLAMPNTGGSVIIANTTAGEWYLYGGSVGALLGMGTALVGSARRLSGGQPAVSRGQAGGRDGTRA